MTEPFRTFALLGLAFGMLAAGYLFAPAPGASSPLARVVPDAPPKPPTTLVANRPPVPLVTQARTSYYTPPAETADKATADKKDDKTTVAALTADQPADEASGDSAQAKRAIEFDGYKNVRGLAKGPDGLWHGRAMRGRTEIAVKADASGSVSAE